MRRPRLRRQNAALNQFLPWRQLGVAIGNCQSVSSLALTNGAFGKSDIEGKAARVAARERGRERVSNERERMSQAFTSSTLLSAANVKCLGRGDALRLLDTTPFLFAYAAQNDSWPLNLWTTVQRVD